MPSEDCRAQFAANLRRARKRADVSQETLGLQAGLHRTEVGLLERAERMPRIDTLVKLAGALGVYPADLLDGIAWEPGKTRPGHFERPPYFEGRTRPGSDFENRGSPAVIPIVKNPRS